jgi:uncharacterized delta-60 repeat protein
MSYRLILATALAAFATTASAGVMPSIDAGVDLAFGSNGWRRLFEIGGNTQNERAVGFARSADGGWIVVAEVDGGAADGGNGKRIGLFRLDHDGNFVTSGFGTAGRRIKDAWLTSVTAMTVDASGRIIVVGGTPGLGGVDDFGVVRFNPDGSDDTSFAGDGGTSFSFEIGSTAFTETPRSVLAEADGGIVIAGDLGIDSSDHRVGVVRLHADGSLDTTFGNLGGSGGFHGTDMRFRDGESAYASRILAVAGGYYVVAGTTVFSATDTDFAARILTPSGAPWADFAGSARFAIDEPGPGDSLYDTLNDAIPVDPLTIVLVGSASGKCAATRIKVGNNSLSPDGSIFFDNLAWDGTFIGSEIAGRPNRFVGALPDSDCQSAALRADGRILLVGGTASSGLVQPVAIEGGAMPDGTTTGRAALLTRLAANGSLDASFGYLGSFAYFAPGGSGTSFHTTFEHVAYDGPKAIVIGSAVDNSTAINDFDAIIVRLASDVIFADGFDD